MKNHYRLEADGLGVALAIHFSLYSFVFGLLALWLYSLTQPKRSRRPSRNDSSKQKRPSHRSLLPRRASAATPGALMQRRTRHTGVIGRSERPALFMEWPDFQSLPAEPSPS
jgi:hypothetical protein